VRRNMRPPPREEGRIINRQTDTNAAWYYCSNINKYSSHKVTFTGYPFQYPSDIRSFKYPKVRDYRHTHTFSNRKELDCSCALRVQDIIDDFYRTPASWQRDINIPFLSVRPMLVLSKCSYGHQTFSSSGRTLILDFWPQLALQNPMGRLVQGRRKFAFSTEIAFYLGNGTR